MAEKTDRRIRKTKAQLRAGLSKLMQTKSIKEITVKELSDEVDINRSTFYLHYTDIYNMLEEIETELLNEIETVINTHPIGPNKNNFSFFIDMFYILSSNKDICSALLGPNGDMSFLHKIEKIISENSIKALKSMGSIPSEDLNYVIAFCLTGCIGLIKTWLIQEKGETPEHMANITYNIISSLVLNYSKENRRITGK